jgi:hypothetical protein
MNRRICRQVLECGDGVREVTALTVAAHKIAKRAAETVSPTQSGDSEDSVAALQDADALAAASFPVDGLDARPFSEVEVTHEPKGRASSPLRADGWNHVFLQCKRRRARSDAPYLRETVHGSHARSWNRGGYDAGRKKQRG